MGKFGANPEIIRAKGNEIIDLSNVFGNNIETVYKTVNEMINSDYLSPEAVAMGNKIQSYRQDMEKMRQIIHEYGFFCVDASSKVIRNQDNIISSIK